jgi:SAM-dependent methyltransferase
LHGRIYALRPTSEHLTLFYLAMSLGGALGGLFTALVAPLVFDWVWEHPLLVLAAALLMPLPQALDWRGLPGLDPIVRNVALGVLVVAAILLALLLTSTFMDPERATSGRWFAVFLALAGLLLVPWRWLFVGVLGMTMLAQGGYDTIKTTLAQQRSRSYFGIYTVRDYARPYVRTLAHGTTLHGQQSLDPKRMLEPMSYYGPTSGAALALGQAQTLYGKTARVGVVGLGTGTLACFNRPGEQWRIFEIDPAVVRYSQNRTFTFVANCAPAAKLVLGDARLKLAQLPKGSLDILVVDAFSSDAIPLHLLTDEAFGVYFDALTPKGLLVLHISNRFIELEPVIAALAKHRGLTVMKRDDNPADRTTLTPSTWLALSRDPAMVAAVGKAQADAPWAALMPPATAVWSDDHASILPFVRWEHLLKTP